MTTDRSWPVPGKEDWEARQRLAAFYQAMIATRQQAGAIHLAVVVMLVSLGGPIASFVGRNDTLAFWYTLYAFLVVANIAYATMLTNNVKIASRIRRDYERDHFALFKDEAAYPLQSILLDFADRPSRLVKDTSPDQRGTQMREGTAAPAPAETVISEDSDRT